MFDKSLKILRSLAHRFKKDFPTDDKLTRISDDQLNNYQLRKVADFLFDGDPLVAHYMHRVRQFKDGDRILLWFVRENIKGKKLVEFFKNESDGCEGMSILRGVETARRLMSGNVDKLRGSDLKVIK